MPSGSAASSVVPGNASGGMDGVALKGLTVDFHEPGFAAQLGGENKQPFPFQMNGEQRQQAGRPWGPANAQALNRYSYGLNNPVKHTDPTGHFAALLALPLLAITAPAWVVPVAIGVGVVAVGAGIAYAAVQVKNHLNAEEKPAENTNPYAGPVDEPVIAVDQQGNAIPVNKGEQLTGSPDGRFVQVRNGAGEPTGVRLDGPHKPASHPDPRAQDPHAHVPGVTNPDGTPWLPVKGAK